MNFMDPLVGDYKTDSILHTVSSKRNCKTKIKQFIAQVIGQFSFVIYINKLISNVIRDQL